VTLKQWLRDWLADDRPPPSPTSMSSTTTPSTNHTAPDPLVQVMEMVVKMNQDSARETRELVLSILQGRPSSDSQSHNGVLHSPETLPIPNYDDESIPLPSGIMGVFSREEEEAEELRQLQTEQQRLKDQLRDARMAMLLKDPQGPDSMTSS
jgi:hypothetical protein